MVVGLASFTYFPSLFPCLPYAFLPAYACKCPCPLPLTCACLHSPHLTTACYLPSFCLATLFYLYLCLHVYDTTIPPYTYLPLLRRRHLPSLYLPFVVLFTYLFCCCLPPWQTYYLPALLSYMCLGPLSAPLVEGREEGWRRWREDWKDGGGGGRTGWTGWFAFFLLLSSLHALLCLPLHTHTCLYTRLSLPPLLLPLYI